eukprot:scaffold110025_cov22-Prasinocladus_malaysianus.AAC.1
MACHLEPLRFVERYERPVCVVSLTNRSLRPLHTSSMFIHEWRIVHMAGTESINVVCMAGYSLLAQVVEDAMALLQMAECTLAFAAAALLPPATVNCIHPNGSAGARC